MGAVFSPNGTPCDNLDAKAYLERNGYKVTYQNYDTEGVLKEVSKRFPVFICGQDYTANKAPPGYVTDMSVDRTDMKSVS